MEIISKIKDPNWWIENSLENLYFFNRHVLCTLEDPTPGFKHLYEPTHKRLINFVNTYAKPGEELLILMPRSWLKSYVITCGWLLQRILRNIVRKTREMWIINNATEANSIELLSRLKYNLQFNDTLRPLFQKPLFPENIIPRDPENQAERWTQQQIQVLGNRIETGAVEKALESRHYGGGMINDDLVNWDNSRTRDQLEKTIDWWKISRSLKMPWSIIFNIGTRWDEDDVYGYIMSKFLRIDRKKFEELKKQPIFEFHRGKFHLFQVSCYKDPVNERGSTFPTLYPYKEIKQLIEEQGDLSGGQYLNDPIAMSKSMFRRPWFTVRWKVLPDIRTTLMTVDPTGKEKNESDYTGMVIVDAGVDKKLYVRFAQRELVTDMSLVEWIIKVALKYYPLMIGIEENKFRSIVELMELKIPELIRCGQIPKEHMEYVQTLPYICVELTHKGRPKPTRISHLTGWIEPKGVLGSRLLFAPAEMEDVIDELIRCPKAKKDDIADALAYILDLLAMVGFPKPTDPVKYLAVPDELKKTPEQRMREDWEQYKDDAKGLEDYEEALRRGEIDEDFLEE